MELSQAFNGFIQSIVSNLGTSPFRSGIDSIASLPYLNWLNWFFPVSECLAIGTTWLGAITIFYLWMVIARWVKLISD